MTADDSQALLPVLLGVYVEVGLLGVRRVCVPGLPYCSCGGCTVLVCANGARWCSQQRLLCSVALTIPILVGVRA